MKQLLRKGFLWLTPLALVIAGCNRQTALVPPQIHYGLETCADCGMIINDPHYAASVIWRATPDGSTRTAAFDDIGCLVNWRRHHAKAQILAAWVKDVRTADWLDAASAHYVHSPRLATPMGWGVAAGTATNDFSALPTQPPLLTWTELLKTGATVGDAAAFASHNTADN